MSKNIKIKLLKEIINELKGEYVAVDSEIYTYLENKIKEIENS